MQVVVRQVPLLVMPNVQVDFSTVYQTWFHEVLRWLRALGAPPSEIEDLAQDVFIVVERRLPDFDGANMAGWLYRISRNAVRDFRRKAWFRNLFLRPRDAIDPASPAANAAELLEQKESEARLHALIETLSEKRRVTFVLFEIEGYSGEEIATLCEVPLATVWTRLHHARRELAARLAENHDKESR